MNKIHQYLIEIDKNMPIFMADLLGEYQYFFLSEVILALCIIAFYFLFKFIQNNQFLVRVKIPGVGLSDLIDVVKSGEKKGHILIGISKENGNFIWRNLKDNPGFLAVGKQGGGKTVTLVTLLTVSQLTDGERVFQILIDPSSKGFTGASNLFDLDNTVTVVRDIKKTIPVFNMLYEEMEYRGRVFANLDKILRSCWPEGRKILKGDPIDKYITYDKIMPHFIKHFRKIVTDYGHKDLSKENKEIFRLTGEANILNFKDSRKIDILKKMSDANKIEEDERGLLLEEIHFEGLALIMICFDEFSSYLQSDEISYFEKSHEEGSTAYQIAQIATKGRAMGLGYFMGTQSASRSVITREFKDSISNYLAHKTNDSDASSAIELPESASLPNIQGRAVYNSDSGRAAICQVPFIKPETSIDLFQKMKKPFEGELYAFKKEDYEGISSGHGYSGYIKNYPKLTQVLQSSSAFDHEGRLLFCGRILGLYGFEMEFDLREEIEINAYAKRGEQRYAVLIDYTKGKYGESVITTKSIAYIEKESEHIQIDGFIVFDFKKDDRYGGDDLRGLVTRKGGYFVDLEDLGQICKVFQNRDSSSFERKKKDLVLSKPPVASGRSEKMGRSDLRADYREMVDIDEEDDEIENFKEINEKSIDKTSDENFKDLNLSSPSKNIPEEDEDDSIQNDLLSEDQIDDLFSKLDDHK